MVKGRCCPQQSQLQDYTSLLQLPTFSNQPIAVLDWNMSQPRIALFVVLLHPCDKNFNIKEMLKSQKHRVDVHRQTDL